MQKMPHLPTQNRASPRVWSPICRGILLRPAEISLGDWHQKP